MTQSVRVENVVPDNAKWAFTTRRVTRSDVAGINRNVREAVAGDLVLCRITAIGQHKKIQLAEGRYALSYENDLVVMLCGDRYAPDQFEGFSELNPEGSDVLAGGGLVGRMVAAHDRMSEPTSVRPLGLLVDDRGEVINVANYAIAPARIPSDTLVIGVFGSSMNAGKTTAAVSLAHGLKKCGYKVEGVKATGTGAFGDYNAFLDAGIPASDFTDAGMGSTYCMPMERIENGFEHLVGNAAKRGAEAVVVEIADGVFQHETARILYNSRIKRRLDAVMFAAPDALGALGGVNVLSRHNLKPFAISGKVTCSPLAIKELSNEQDVTLLSREDLLNPDRLQPALARINASRLSLARKAA